DLQSYGYTPYPLPVSIEPVKETPAPVKRSVNKNTVIFAVWAAGALAMTLYGVISYILLMRKLRTAVKTEEGVYESDLISTAFSAGFFPPKIYVPCGLFEEERKLIIAHERVHIRRLDYIVKPVAFLALAVHWFNPLIWLSFALMTRDMELSCDEAVLKIFGAGEKKAYSEALLHVSMKRSGLVDNYKFMPLAFAETGIKGRVKNVLKYKKPTLIATVLAAAVVIAACAALGTNAKSKAADLPEEIEYTEFSKGIAYHLTDVNGNDIYFSVDRFNEPKNSGIYYSRALVEGDIDFDSSTVNFGDSSLKRLIMAVDMTEFKVNSLEVFSEWGKSFFRAQFEFTLAEDAANPKRDGLIRLGGDDEPRMLMVEGGGYDRVYTVSAEYELKNNYSGQFAFELSEFGEIPVYVNSDLVKAEENVYVPLSEGDTVYSLDSGENVCVEYDPVIDIKIADIVQKIAFNAEPEEGSKHRSVLIGMRAKNNELNRQCGADFTGEEITGLAIDDISVSQDKFTVKFKITYPEGGGGFFANEDEPNSNIRLVRSENENVYYLYLTSDYDRGNLDEYAIDICGFDDIIPQINAKFNAAEEEAPEYTRILGGSAQFTLETGETGYVAYGLNELSINFGKDKGTLSVRGIKDRGVSIGCFKTISEGSEEMDFCDVLDFGDHPVTAVTIENMYTERIGSNVKLYTEIKVTSPEGDGLMNSMAVNGGEFEMGVAKLINDEYLFTIIKEYDAADIVIDGFAVVIAGFETPPYINTDYEIPIYVNSALDPQSPQIITYDAYSDFTSYKTAIDCSNVKMAYNHDRKTIYLYNNGDFKVYGFSDGYVPDNDLCDGYSVDGETLVLKFTDGSMLYFDMVSSGMDATDPELVEKMEMCRYKLVYNKELSHISDGQSGDIPDFYNDEVFVPDESFIDLEKHAEESARKYAEEMEQQRQRIYEELAVLKREAEERRKLTEEAEDHTIYSYPALQYPVDGVVTADYGDGRGHKGIDFYAEKGTEVYAAADGTVSETDSGWNGGYGNSVTIDHGFDMETLYAHLSDITVKEGDEVAKGDLIGHSGSTGDTTQNGIHFEVRLNGRASDPADYLTPPLPSHESYTEKTVSARYFGTDLITSITLYDDGTFLVENYISSNYIMNRPEKEYKFENGILSLKYNTGSVLCFEAVGNYLEYRKDLSEYTYAVDTSRFGGSDTFELIEGTSLNGGRIEMETMELNGKAYFLVSNETQLRAIGGILYTLDLDYMQQCDIELSPDEWKSIGTRANPFTGSYNGNGFEIKGLTMADPYAPLIGMFGYAENANIYNITLRDYDIEKAGSKAKTKSVAPIVAINVGSRVYDNNVYPKGE
ncbi:MAG: peptidoglycan DD-metalloendopeptidase family protein, partial [Oscillospiraceae bacterium]|nr:peptidoglycan DD-metalloendopeptidase family protein [Oscillospiraceae bacterium]